MLSGITVYQFSSAGAQTEFREAIADHVMFIGGQASLSAVGVLRVVQVWDVNCTVEVRPACVPRHRQYNAYRKYILVK